MNTVLDGEKESEPEKEPKKEPWEPGKKEERRFPDRTEKK
jgi:hypothetical protein